MVHSLRRRGSRALVALALCAGATTLLATSAPALAAPGAAKSEPSASDKETARSLVLLGDEKMAAGDYEAALKAYRGADAIMGVPTTGIEVGRAEIALGKLVEATDTLLRVARYPQEANEPEAFAKAREEAAKIGESLPARIPTLTIEIYGIEPGTPFEVRLDGELLEAATLGLPRKVNPGKHHVVATSVDYRPADQSVEVAEREQRVLRLSFEEQAPADAEEEASLAEPVFYVGVAVTAVGVVVGAITGGISLSVAGDVKDQCTNDVCPTSTESDADRSLALGHVSTASFVVAGAGAVVGAVAAFFWLAQPDDDAADGEAAAQPFGITPEIGWGTIGLRGRF